MIGTFRHLHPPHHRRPRSLQTWGVTGVIFLFCSGLLPAQTLPTITVPVYRLGHYDAELPPQTDTTQSISSWSASSPALDYDITGNHICFTGPPGDYTLTHTILTITVTVDWDARTSKLALSSATRRLPIVITSGPPGPNPPGPNPPPDPPGPPDRPLPPPDKFDNIGQRAGTLTAQLTPPARALAPSVAGLYTSAAAKLAAGGFVNATESYNWLKTEREKLWSTDPSLSQAWSELFAELTKTWNKYWPLSKDEVIALYEALAAGFRYGAP